MGPLISPEQFIEEHIFIFLINGKMNGYDGKKHHVLMPGDCCIIRKNQLVRYNKQKDKTEFKKIVIVFDEVFLKSFLSKHKQPYVNYASDEAFLEIKQDVLISSFVQSLQPYYGEEGKLPLNFADVKREELLLILLQLHPEYTNILFDFGIPGKIDLEAFMNKNFKFNVSIERFAYLTGRSLSSFKRDFQSTFNETPNKWLIKKRLEEAYFLLQKKGYRPSDIYLDLGFEDLSHFSFTFKKRFGHTPTEIANNVKSKNPSLSLSIEK